MPERAERDLLGEEARLTLRLNSYFLLIAKVSNVHDGNVSLGPIGDISLAVKKISLFQKSGKIINKQIIGVASFY